MDTLEDVYTKRKLGPALDKVNHEVSKYFKSLSLDEFFIRSDNKWSAYDTLRHLTKSARAVTWAMRMPHFLLGLMFGASDKPSRQYLQIKEAYLSHLQMGAQAGRFAPEYKEIPATQAEAEVIRRKTIRRWRRTSRSMVRSLRGWTDHRLDKYLLPHPILGKLSVREMLLFTLYHNLHHANTIKKRVEEMRSRLR